MAQVFDEADARACAATSPSATPATPPPAARSGRTPSRPSAPPRPAPRRARPQRQPGQHRRARPLVASSSRSAASCRSRSTMRRCVDHRHRPGDDAAGRPPRPVGRGRRAGGAAEAARRVQLRLHGREHPVRRPRPPGRPPAGARPARARLGGRQRDRRAGHRRRALRPRDRARRADRASTSTACARSRFADAEPKGCLFEYVYLARPDTTIAGRNVYAARVEVGRRLAEEHPVEADLVIPVPESGTPGRDRLRRGVRHPLRPGPGQERLRRPHLHPAVARPSASSASGSSSTRCARSSRGKRLVVVDDSIVRGNTQRALVRMLREAGAVEVHVRISVAAGQVAVLLRHRLRHPRRADRQRARRSRGSAARSAPTRSATSRSTA